MEVEFCKLKLELEPLTLLALRSLGSDCDVSSMLL